MFDVTVVKTKAGYIGQVCVNQKILWESEPFPTEMAKSPNDRLERSYDLGGEKATRSAQDKIMTVMEGLFA